MDRGHRPGDRAPRGCRATEYALHPFEDEAANKRLELWVEHPTADATLAAELLRRLAEVNQDFRESIRMVPAEHRPQLRVWARDSPMSQQDPRIKKRYIL